MARVEADRCCVYGGFVDLRRGANTLRVLTGGCEPGVRCGTRRLHNSRFDWPESPEGRRRLTAEELACLLTGGDVKKHGNPRLRTLLVECAWLLLKWNLGYAGVEKRGDFSSRLGGFASPPSMTRWTSHCVTLEEGDADSRLSRGCKRSRGRGEDARRPHFSNLEQQPT